VWGAAIFTAPTQRAPRPFHVSIPPAEIDREYLMGRIPETLARRAYNLKRVADMPRGGHFAALEQPQLLRKDMTAFFRTLR
jgi:hypothetical protein